MVAFPPGPFTSMGLWVDRAESLRAMGLKLGVYSMLQGSEVSGSARWFQVLGVEDERCERMMGGDRGAENLSRGRKTRSACSVTADRQVALSPFLKANSAF